MFEPLLADVAHHLQLAVRQGTEIAHQIRPPVAATDYANFDLFWHKFLFFANNYSPAGTVPRGVIDRASSQVNLSWPRLSGSIRGARFFAEFFISQTSTNIAGSVKRYDLQVQPRRLVLHITQVQIDHLLECRPVLSADLPQPRQSRRRSATPLVPRRKQIKFIRRAGPRTNQAHLAAQYIDQLRQFIDPSARKTSPARYQTPDPRRNPISASDGWPSSTPSNASGGPSCRVDLHCPKLQAQEPPPKIPNPLLTEKCRSWRNDLDETPMTIPTGIRTGSANSTHAMSSTRFHVGIPARHVLRLRVARRPFTRHSSASGFGNWSGLSMVMAELKQLCSDGGIP